MKRVRLSLLVILLLAGSLSIPIAPYASASPSAPGPGSGIKGDAAPATWPASMAATGDSITRAFNTGSVPFTDAPANSWSTGTNSSVNSHYLRILAAYPPINGRNYNDAVSGAKMTDLNGQMAAVNSQHVDYVTVMMGANDACTPTEAQMTPVSTFSAQFQAALDTLAGVSPNAHVYLLSVPNIYNLWSILHNDAGARSAWALFGICQSMLANPQSTAQADVDRRNRVNQRVVDFNTQLAQVCAGYGHCRFDNNAVFNTTFTASDVSTRDYFHPSISGQARLAAVSYAAGYNFGAPSVLVSHTTWQGPPPQPDPLQQLPVTLSLTLNTSTTTYTATTDVSGLFTVTVDALPGGTYSWWAKGPKYLARAGTVVLDGSQVISLDLGTFAVGDADNNNAININDFAILRATFGKAIGDQGYDDRADFNGDHAVGITDFGLMRGNFGQSGAPPP